MKKTPIVPDKTLFPKQFHPIIADAKVYDSSCSPEARVYFIDKDGGYYLKTSKKGTLAGEAMLTEYFHSKKLAPHVADYLSSDKDWLLTEKVRGEDCTEEKYLDEPKKLCDKTAELLRELHETDFSGCPVQNRSDVYISTVCENRKNGMFDAGFGYKDADEAFAVAEKNMKYLKNDTLLHGDYCLPNVKLDNWKFSSFIDLGNGGVGDRHIDIFWGIWTLQFNLGTNEYAKRFIDAYGSDRVEADMLRVIAACESFG